MAIVNYRKRKTRLSYHLLFKDNDDGSDIDFKIEPTTRQKKLRRRVLFCKWKTNIVYKDNKVNCRLNRVWRPITKWVLTK